MNRRRIAHHLYSFCQVDRYNNLLLTLHHSLKDLELGVQGLVVVTPELEDVMEALLEFKAGFLVA